MQLAASSSRLFSPQRWTVSWASPLSSKSFHQVLYHSNRDEIQTQGMVIWRWNVPHHLVGLNTWSLAAGTAWEGCGSIRKWSSPRGFPNTFALGPVTSCHQCLCAGLNEKRHPQTRVCEHRPGWWCCLGGYGPFRKWNCVVGGGLWKHSLSLFQLILLHVCSWTRDLSSFLLRPPVAMPLPLWSLSLEW